MNNKQIARLVESKNLSFDEVSLMDSASRVAIGLPAIIPQTDYTGFQQIIDSVVPNFLGLRKAFGLDQEIGAQPLFNTDTDTSGKMSDYYRRETAFANNRGALYTLVSEMAAHPLISAALDIYANEATVPDPVSGKVAWVECDDANIRAELTDLLGRLGLDGDKAYSICYSMAEYGDNFEHIVADQNGVIGLKYVHPTRLTRIEDRFGRLQGFAAGILTPEDAKWENNMEKMPEKVSYPWDIAHFRIQSTNRESLHGDPMTLPARRAYQQLKMVEDMLVLYRLSRGMDRDVYYVNVRGATPTQSWRTVHEFRQQVRKNLGVDPLGGKMRQEYNPKTPDKDLFVPTSGTDDPTRVERQKGGGPQGDIPDVDHFRRVLLGALRIPAGYIGFETDTPSRATLSSQSARFARAVRRLQKAYIQGVRWICESHLIRRGFTTRDDQGRMLAPFRIKMSPVNQVEELTKMEILTQQIEIAQSLQSLAQIQSGEPDPNTGIVTPFSPIVADSRQFIAWNFRKNLKMSDSEIELFMGDKGMGMTQDDLIMSQIMEKAKESGVGMDAFEESVKEAVTELREVADEYVDESFVVSESQAEPGDFDLDKQEDELRESLNIKDGPIIKCPSCKEQGMSIRHDSVENRDFLFCTNCGHSQTT